MATINGTNDNNNLSGTAGTDTINGLGGNDIHSKVLVVTIHSAVVRAPISLFSRLLAVNGFDTITGFRSLILTHSGLTPATWTSGRTMYGTWVPPTAIFGSSWIPMAMDNGTVEMNTSRCPESWSVPASKVLIVILVGGNIQINNFSFGDNKIDFVASTDTEPESETPSEPMSPSDSDDGSMEMTGDDAADGFAPADSSCVRCAGCRFACRVAGLLLRFCLSRPFQGVRGRGKRIRVAIPTRELGPNSGTTIVPNYDDGDQCTG